MTPAKIIIACRVFEDELQHVLQDGEAVEIIWIDAALHADLPRMEQALKEALAAACTTGREVRVFLGVGCHPDLAELAGKNNLTLSTTKTAWRPSWEAG
jgi:hypothetical protein